MTCMCICNLLFFDRRFKVNGSARVGESLEKPVQKSKACLLFRIRLLLGCVVS